LSHSKLEPKLVTVLREGYTRQAFVADLSAGVMVGIVALPLAIAFAIASGVKPEQGLITAIVAGFLISALGGSRVQIGGPTGAFIVIVYGVVQQHGYGGLALATVMAGAMLVFMGLTGMGSVIKFIPYPVTVGFTAGIALIILSGQVRDLLGLQMEAVPAEFVQKWLAYAAHHGSVNPFAAGIGVLTVAVVVLWRRITYRIPGSLVALILATILVQVLDLPVETIGSRFGEISVALPVPRLPAVSWELIREMSPAALSIALLAGIESLLSAVVADGMTGRRHRSNMELVAQGVANMVSPLFGGIPATGAIARTATNVKSGGRTPVAGIVHAVVLLLMLTLFGKWAGLVPLPALAGVLVVVAYHMGEWHLFARLFRSPGSDVVVLVATFLLTVLVDLVVAIQVGVVLAAFLFMRRMAEVTEVGFVSEMLEDGDAAEEVAPARQRTLPAGIEVFQINGPFFFGAADKFQTALARIRKRPRVLILRLRQVPSIDATGLHALGSLLEQARHEGTAVVLCGLRPAPYQVLQRAGLIDAVGQENVRADFEDSLARAREMLADDDAPGVSPGV
jgi:SulP family sulfate permease